jgi:hypothetical protein
MGKINNYANAVPTLSDKIIGTDINDSNATKNFLIEDVLALYGDPIGVCHASFYSTQDQAFTGSSGYVTTTFNVADALNSNITVVSNSNITVANAGVYKIDVSLNISNISASPITSGFVFIGLGINGTPIQWGSRSMALNLAATPNSWNTIYGSWMLNLSANDYVNLYFKTTSASYASIVAKANSSSGGGTSSMSQMPSATLQISKV